MSFFATRHSTGYSAGITGLLLLVTALALVSQTFDANKEIDLNDIEFTVVDDRSEGGESQASIIRKNDGFHLNCKIRKSSVSWPYCSVSFNFFDGKKGIDLSAYQQFTLWIRYAKPRAQGFRFQVRNFDHAYSTQGNDLSLKYNSIELYSDHASYPFEVPLQGFQVPTWWLVLQNLSHQYSVPEFSNVYSIDVVTGYVMPEGDYEIIIEKITLQGKWISNDKLYLILLLSWGVLGFLFWLSHWPVLQKIKSETKPSRDQQERALFSLLETKRQTLMQRIALQEHLNFDSLQLSQYLLARAETQQYLSILLIESDQWPETLDAQEEQLGIISKTLVRSLRQTDMLARWGEFGFILVCPDTELANASQLAEKLRVNVENQCNNENPNLSISIGIAQLYSDTPENILQDAEKALQTAKTNGNCAIAATPSTVKIEMS